MTLKNSQLNMYQHSEVKVELLKKYLERYLNILNQSPYTNDVNIYDLFCAEGIYDNGGKGSPICILETIKDIITNQSKGVVKSKFNCLFNDKDSSKIEKLKAAIKVNLLHSPETGGLEFDNKDYKEILPKVIAETKKFQSQKGFVFIDPYGYKEIQVKDIKSLLSSKKTEVLLFLPTQFMFRFEKNGTPQSLKDFITELLPEKNWPHSTTGIDFIENLKDAFRENIGKDYFIDSFIITRDKNQFFCLFFFTSHIYGFDRMLDVKWKIDEEEGRGWSDNEDSLFSQTVKTPNTFKYERNLINFLKYDFKSNADIYEFTLHNGHLPKHATQMLTKFQNDGELIVNLKDGSKARKGSFYVNYQDWRDNSDKVKIKMR